jgi:hypothetical protein
MSQNIGVHRIFSGSRTRPGPCENSRRHWKYLQSGRFRAAKIGQSPAELMNPNSDFYLAINTGFPNAFDKANGRDGSFLMIHGDCSSSGCYSMTDEQMGEIYSLARDSFLGGHPSFQIQAYPFRLTPANLARHRTNPHVAFWQMLKIGNDHFEATHLEPKVEVCDRRYVFDTQPPPNSPNPLVFNPTGACPAFVVNPKIVRPALEKQRADEVEYAQLVEDNVSVAPIYRTRRRNERGFPRTLSGQSNIVRESVSACISTAAIATRPLVDNDGSLASRLFGTSF